MGQPVRPEHFEPGAGALTAWRSEGAQGKDILTTMVLRLNRTPAVDAALHPEQVGQMLAGEFIAFPASTPFRCCLLTWHTSLLAERFGHQEHLFDTCHFSSFDPYRLVSAEVPPRRLPEPGVPPASPNR
jgi:hypothetical protein